MLQVVLLFVWVFGRRGGGVGGGGGGGGDGGGRGVDVCILDPRFQWQSCTFPKARVT